MGQDTFGETRRAYCEEPDGCQFAKSSHPCDGCPNISKPSLTEKPFLTDDELNKVFGGLSNFINDDEIYCFYKSVISNFVDEKLQQANARISELEKSLKLLLTGLKAENIDDLVAKAKPEDYLTYGKLYSDTAQDKISELSQWKEKAERLEKERDEFALDFGRYVCENITSTDYDPTPGRDLLEQFKQQINENTRN